MISVWLGIFAAFALGLLLRPKPRIQHVYDTESETVARVRERCENAIEWREKRVLSDRCGWSEADDLRAGISHYRDILETLGVPNAD